VARSSALFLALLAGCAEYYDLDPEDIDLEPPEDLELRLRRFRSGEEAWHGDPRMLADVTLRNRLDVPWKADRYRPGAYEVLKSPEWGDYVVRGFTYPSGHTARYRVKIRPYREIWYPVQISRFKRHVKPDEHGHSH
jgi:hypothetical protein